MLIADQSTRHGADGGWVSFCSLTASAFGLHVDEDRENDSERAHTNETASYFAFSREGFLPLRKYADVNIDSIGGGSEEKPIQEIIFTTLPQTIFAGQVSTVMTIRSVDGDGFEANVLEDVDVRLLTSSLSGQFSLSSVPFSQITNVVIPAGQSEASFYYKDDNPGTYTLTAYEYPSMGWDDARQSITVLPVSAGFLVTIEESQPIIAGASFTLTLTAVNDDGAVAPSYSGTASLTISYIDPATGTETLSVAAVSGFVDGIAQVQVSYPDAGTITITATDVSDPTLDGTSANILFIPASLSVAAGDQHTVDQPFSLTVQALNSLGSVTPNYTGPVNLIIITIDPSADQGGRLDPLTMTSFSNGEGVLTNLTYNKWGTIQIQAQDGSYPSLQGISEEARFYANSFEMQISEPPESRQFFYENEAFTMTVTVRSFLDAIISNYAGNVNIFSSETLNLPEIYSFLPGENGIHTFDMAGTTEGTYDVTFIDIEKEDVTGTSPLFTIKFAQIIIGSSEGPVGILPVEIMIADKDGKVIVEDNSTRFLVSLTESRANNSASTDATDTWQTFKSGHALIEILDSEAEEVTIRIEEVQPELGSNTGSAVFGIIGDRGIRIKFWREKD